MEYIKVLMKYESNSMPILYYYEVDLKQDRQCCRAIEVFSNGRQINISDFYKNVIEVVPIPTKEEFDQGIFGTEFEANIISQKEFEELWKLGNENS